jgi:FixJ family two-component response regulator
MSGPDLAQKLSPERPSLKVMYISGYSDDAIAQHGVLAPGVTLLAKPFTRDALTRKVREVLDRAEA